MDFDALLAKIQTRFPAVTIEAPKVDAGDRFVMFPAENAYEIFKFLKEDPELYFDSLMSLAGVDSGRELWVVYPLHSMKHCHKLLCKVLLPRENPECDSVVNLWMVANFFEREVYDLFGVKFRNHPDLRRILNPQDWEGWPGRKDYIFPAAYHGVPTVREDQFFKEEIDKEVAAREEKEKALFEQHGLTATK